MSDTVKKNVPRGLRPGFVKRPAHDEDSWVRIVREQEKMKEREFVRFSIFKLDPAWRRLEADTRHTHKEEVIDVVQKWSREMMLYSYSLVGTRGDADCLLWQASKEIDPLHGLAADLNATGMGGYLTTPYAYLAMTKRSIYLNRYEKEYKEKYGGADNVDRARLAVNPQGSRYLFVYPMAKTRRWYGLPHEDRQRMMDEHIRVGHEWPDVKLNTTYSYGMDDQEFVVAFESDHPGRFLDLLMALRLTEASSYTLFDTPAFTALAMPIGETLDALG